MAKNKVCINCKHHFVEEIILDNPQSCCGKEFPKRLTTTEPFLSCEIFEYSDKYLVAKLQREKENLIKWLKEEIEYNKNLMSNCDSNYEVIDSCREEIGTLENVLRKVSEDIDG